MLILIVLCSLFQLLQDHAEKFEVIFLLMKFFWSVYKAVGRLSENVGHHG